MLDQAVQTGLLSPVWAGAQFRLPILRRFLPLLPTVFPLNFNQNYKFACFCLKKAHMSIKMQIGCNETQQRKAATPTIRKLSVACGTSFFGAAVVNDLVKFKERSQSVIA